MRWIVASLAILNLVVFVGQLLLPSAETGIPPAKAPGVDLRQAPAIQLLSELSPGSLRVKAQPSPAVLATEIEEPLCTLVGPFPRLLNAEYFVERLQALDVVSEVRELEIPGEPNFWVYLPAEGTDKQALDRLRELQAKGIDSYLIPKGEYANGISIGMFSREELAERRLADLRQQGYAAELTQVPRTYKEIFVVLPPGESSELDATVWQRMLATEDGLQRRQNYCPPVASPENIQ